MGEQRTEISKTRNKYNFTKNQCAKQTNGLSKMPESSAGLGGNVELSCFFSVFSPLFCTAMLKMFGSVSLSMRHLLFLDVKLHRVMLFRSFAFIHFDICFAI